MLADTPDVLAGLDGVESGARQTRWDAVFLVCKACGKRSHAPKNLKPKTLVAGLRQATKAAASRPKIVLTSCLGLCPKKAMAVASVGAGQAPRIAAIESRRQLEAFAAPARTTSRRA